MDPVDLVEGADHVEALDVVDAVDHVAVDRAGTAALAEAPGHLEVPAEAVAEVHTVLEEQVTCLVLVDRAEGMVAVTISLKGCYRCLPLRRITKFEFETYSNIISGLAFAAALVLAPFLRLKPAFFSLSLIDSTNTPLLMP